MNKFYIQIVLFLLSIFVYGNNEILAIEPAPEENTTPKSKSRYPTSEEIYEKNKHLLCKCSTQARNAAKLMNEAVKHLEYHATDIGNYESCKAGPNVREFLYKKKHKDHTVIEKIQYTISDSNKYNEIINKLWNSGTPNTFDKGSVKIVHMYNPNLLIIQQRYEKDSKGHQKYFYALATKAEVSKDKTIIAMTSLGIKDGRTSFRREYENPIIENVSSFYAYITPEDDIKNGELEKVLVNLAGYFIEKKGDNIEVTYIESIDGHASF
ncbi:fam-a protein [Plasmodium vinckei petteri]|uniref:Fam-a protein n=1 Tax=Plasmodium vinckei petteri TaxID=138298 RepID=A0A6V7SXU8_PLAVN|nr:fam-a protein [Plasmodium vinckei petteri]